MGRLKSIVAICALALVAAASSVQARTVRATDLNSAIWSEINKGTATDIIVEFRQGDRLPVTINAEGDLIETTEVNNSYVVVKRNFWIQPQANSLLLSLDGQTFKPVGDLLTGSLEAGAGAPTGGIANAINVTFKAYLK